ncbi:MAG: glycoside hydrolase family 9 protein [Phycisphaerae bacterium]|nr:glycoside hydrolase family 9 protein [Phycisphaerales bacterium]
MRHGIVVAFVLIFGVSPAIAAESAWIRVNLIGYLPDDPKVAVLSSMGLLEGEFRVGEFKGSIGTDEGAWGPFAHNYRLDFSAVRAAGRYRVEFKDIKSEEFSIDAKAYATVPQSLLQFMQLQRCGDNPVEKKKCHQKDGIDTTTGKQVDLVGGWHDAGDRLKHMITTTYCIAALKLAGANEEAAYGAPMLKKIHPNPETLYVQVGDDRDHLPPETLWHDDQSDYGWGPGGPRSAWPATTEPAGPKYKNKSSGLASLAGRVAAAAALNGDIALAESALQLAEKHPGCAMSVPVRAPYYYGESTYHDDVEWAATELFIATKDPKYLNAATASAKLAGASKWMGDDAHGHYEFFPYVNLAHWRLYEHVDDAMKRELAAFYRTGLERIEARANRNPYRIGTPFVWCSTNDVIAVATQAVLYERMTGDKRFRMLATDARDWIFGRNPWGKSFVIGVPNTSVASSKPHHLFYKLAGILPVGGLVDGPVTREINQGLKFSEFEDRSLEPFQSDVAVYHDAFADFSTNEPIIDGTVSLLLLVSLWN